MLARAISRPSVSVRSLGKYPTLTTLRPTAIAKALSPRVTQRLLSNSRLKATNLLSSRPLPISFVKVPANTIRNMSTSTDQKVDLGNYEVLTEFSLDYAPVTVTKYRSKKTGFQVVVGNHKGKSAGSSNANELVLGVTDTATHMSPLSPIQLPS